MISFFPWYIFLVWISLLFFSFSPLQRKNKLLILGLGLLSVLLTIEILVGKSLLAFPVTILSYCRILENTLLFNLNLIFSLPVISHFRPSPLKHLKLLPPYSTEIYWYEIHQHDRILANAFQENSQQALAIYQKMQTFSLVCPDMKTL